MMPIPSFTRAEAVAHLRAAYALAPLLAGDGLVTHTFTDEQVSIMTNYAAIVQAHWLAAEGVLADAGVPVSALPMLNNAAAMSVPSFAAALIAAAYSLDDIPDWSSEGALVFVLMDEPNE